MIFVFRCAVFCEPVLAPSPCAPEAEVLVRLPQRDQADGADHSGRQGSGQILAHGCACAEVKLKPESELGTNKLFNEGHPSACKYTYINIYKYLTTSAHSLINMSQTV